MDIEQQVAAGRLVLERWENEMRASSWYQQKGNSMKCDCQEGCSENERCPVNEQENTELPKGYRKYPCQSPTVSLPCVSFVPARAAYHEIKEGTLLPRTEKHFGVFIRDVEVNRVSIGVGRTDLASSNPCGYWDKEGLRRFGEALLKLSEYMES